MIQLCTQRTGRPCLRLRATRGHRVLRVKSTARTFAKYCMWVTIAFFKRKPDEDRRHYHRQSRALQNVRFEVAAFRHGTGGVAARLRSHAGVGGSRRFMRDEADEIAGETGGQYL